MTENQDTQAAHDDSQPTPEGTEEQGFNKKQLDQMYSASGRIIDKQFNDKIVPLIQGYMEKGQKGPEPSEFEEKLQTMIFEGRVTEAFDLYQNHKQNKESQIRNLRTTETKKSLTAYADKPYYKDIYQDMEKIAQDLANKGYPPAAAAQQAYSEAKANHLESQIKGTGSPSLNMSTSGTTVRTKSTKLPEQFKKAAQRDIEKGLFKDEQDYIENLSPQIRERYGI